MNTASHPAAALSRRHFLGTASAALAAPIFTRGSHAADLTTVVADGVCDIGSRVEMFVDRWLVESGRGIELRLHGPQKREVVFTADQPWEGSTSGYFTLFRDGSRFRMYYRAAGAYVKGRPWNSHWCLAESDDGIHFTRPSLGLVEFNGSKDNNIILKSTALADGLKDNFAPFLDTNPAARADEKYKALSHGSHARLFAYASPDGVHWRKMQATPVSEDYIGWDTCNTAHWDETAGMYRSWWRAYDMPGVPDLGAACRKMEEVLEPGNPNYKPVRDDDLSVADRNNRNWVRAIASSTSKDFLHWTPPQLNRYPADAPREHLYSNSTVRCPGAPHHLLAFPKRLVTTRTHEGSHPDPAKPLFGVSDALFMSSRDGLHWDRTFREAWVRPGPDVRNWTNRNNMVAWGLLETEDDEFSLYISEHYWWPDARLRRMTVRRHGFASMHAGAVGGVFTTKPLTFTGSELTLNHSTSAAGSVRVEIQDTAGKALPGFSLADCEEIFGDDLTRVVRWKNVSDVSAHMGKLVRLHFAIVDADVFAMQFRDHSNTTSKEI